MAPRSYGALHHEEAQGLCTRSDRRFPFAAFLHGLLVPEERQAQETVATGAPAREWGTHSFGGTARPTDIYMEGVASIVG